MVDRSLRCWLRGGADVLRTAYDQLCISYRAIDDFCAELLGFLPLVRRSTTVHFAATTSENYRPGTDIMSGVLVAGLQRQPQPRDELADIVEPHRAPVQPALSEETEPVLQIVRVGLDRVRQPSQ